MTWKSLRADRKTVRRIGAALRTIHDRLLDAGYVFARPDAALPGPEPGTDDLLHTMARRLGHEIPYALRLVYREIGPVDFCGTPPEGWRGVELPDPIMIIEPSYVLSELEMDLDDPEFEDPLRLILSPDALHKEDVSGGGPYAIDPRDRRSDPWVHGLPVEMSLMSYLYTVLDHGGFPGVPVVRHTWDVDAIARGVLDDVRVCER